MSFRSFRLASTVMGLVCGGIVENSKKFVLCGLFVPLIDMLCYNLNVNLLVSWWFVCSEIINNTIIL